MTKFNLRHLVLLSSIAAIAMAGCGSSSSPTASLSTASVQSSTTSAAPVSRPLTKATFAPLKQSLASAEKPFNAAVLTTDPKMIGAQARTFLAALRTHIADVSALKAQSSAAASAQQRYLSLLKQLTVLVDQLGRAAAANHLKAATAVMGKIDALNPHVNVAQANLDGVIR